MTDVKEKLRKIISAETERCIGRPGGTLSNARDQLKKKYLGYGYSIDSDRAEHGYSTYVDRSVMEAVEWAKPGLFRVFASSDIIRFDPRTPQEEQAAADATLYINQVVFGRSMFTLIHDVLSDGLYQRAGWCLAHCPKEKRQELVQYSGLAEPEAMAVLQDPQLQLSEDGSEVDVEQYPGPDGGMQFDLSIRQTVETRDVRLDPVPAEQVIISEDAPDVEHARFIAHWELKSRSDLLREGYPAELVEDLQTWSEGDEAPETVTARDVNASGNSAREPVTPETTMYQVFEAWFDADVNGDGISEKIKATYVGEAEQCRILKYEEWPLYRAPLFCACSVPLPHQAVGLCLADLVSDLQDVKTEMTRQLLDSLALANQGELVVVQKNGEVDWDSLLSRGPGGAIRATGDCSITPLRVATAAGEAVSGLQLAEEVVQRRTGVSSRTQSLKADALQTTALGASIQEEAVNQRLELIARVYAETFFKPLGRYVLTLLHRYQDKRIQLRLKGKYMAFDPRRWNPDMDIAVSVGLGTGNRAKMLAVYDQILKIQQAFLAQLGPASPVRLSNVIYTCHKMAEAAGLQAPERFFGTEDDARRAEQEALKAKAQQPKISPVDQAKIQAEQARTQAKIQNESARTQADVQAKAAKAQMDAQLQREKMQLNAALKSQELAQERAFDEVRTFMGGTVPMPANIRQQAV